MRKIYVAPKTNWKFKTGDKVRWKPLKNNEKPSKENLIFLKHIEPGSFGDYECYVIDLNTMRQTLTNENGLVLITEEIHQQLKLF